MDLQPFGDAILATAARHFEPSVRWTRDPFSIVVASAACHPDWTLADHLAYLVSEEYFDLDLALVRDVDAFIREAL